MPITDYAILDGLSPRRGRRDFVSWVDQHFAETVADTPENRVFYTMKMLEKDPPESNFITELESRLIGVLARMESTGVDFDREKLMDIGTRIRTDIRRLETEIYETIGEHFNLNSPKQLQVILFEKLGIKPTKKNKTGYSVDTDVLEEIAKTYDIARLILEYRTLAKLSSTYVEGLLKSIAEDGRIHTTYDPLGAATGRMSSNDPNLQNIPTGDGYAREIKECFVATQAPLARGEGAKRQGGSFLEIGTSSLEGGLKHLLLVADYSQIELRILAFLSQDEALLDAFKNGEDIHTRTAKFLFQAPLGRGDVAKQPGGLVSETGTPNVFHAKGGEDYWKPTSEQRRIAKTVNFGVIYGITGFGLSKTLGVSPWEAQRYVDAFYEKYPGVRKYYDALLEKGRELGYVETYFGRRRYIPSLNDANKTMRAIAEREAMNMPIQGTAADIIKIAMIELDAEIRKRGLEGKMILQIHDELVFDIPRSEEDIFKKMVREIMEGVLTSTDHPAGKRRQHIPPITVDIGVGENWAEAK